MRRLVIPLDQFAHGLEKDLELCLKPYQRGVYRVGKESPILTMPEDNEGKVTAFSLIQNGSRLIKRPVMSYKDIAGEVVDCKGGTLIPRIITANRERFLSLTPTIPAHSRSILLASVSGFITGISEFDNVNSDQYLIRAYQEFITQGYLEYVDFYDIVKEHDCELINQVREFTGTRTWTVFEPKRKGENLFIEDLGDYRIIEWEMRNGGQEHESKGGSLHHLLTGCS